MQPLKLSTRTAQQSTAKGAAATMELLAWPSPGLGQVEGQHLCHPWDLAFTSARGDVVVLAATPKPRAGNDDDAHDDDADDERGSRKWASWTSAWEWGRLVADAVSRWLGRRKGAQLELGRVPGSFCLKLFAILINVHALRTAGQFGVTGAQRGGVANE